MNARSTRHNDEDLRFQERKARSGTACPSGKERITIRLDADILDYFRDAVDRAGGGNYQTFINNALRAYIEGGQKPTLEDTLRRVIREELRAH